MWVCEYQDPHGVDPLPAALCLIAELNLAYFAKTGRITVNVYRDQAAFDAGKPLCGQEAFVPGQNGFPDFDTLMAMKVDPMCVPGETPMGECVEMCWGPIVMNQPPFVDPQPATPAGANK